jgi:hypothetical protein
MAPSTLPPVISSAASDPESDTKTIPDPASESARRLLLVLSNLKHSWLSRSLVLGMGKYLCGHEVLDTEGLCEHGEMEYCEATSAALAKLEGMGAIESTVSEDGRDLWVKEGIELDENYSRLTRAVLFNACEMLHTARMYVEGVSERQWQGDSFRVLNQCVEMAKEIGRTTRRGDEEMVWNTLSAGFCALASAVLSTKYKGYKEDVNALLIYAARFSTTPGGREKRAMFRSMYLIV